MKRHSTRMIFGVAVLATAILFVGTAQAEEKFLPPAPPPPDFLNATKNVTAPSPVAPVAPTRSVASDPNKKLPQYDTGPNVAPPSAKVEKQHDEKPKPKAKPAVKEPKPDSGDAEQPTE